MQHVNIKLFAEPPYLEDLASVIPVFHRWIQEMSLPGTLIDVADYAHVPKGPGVFLIAHEYHLSLDQTGGRLGLLFNRRVGWDGSGVDALRSAFEFVSSAARKLEQEPELSGKLKFGSSELEIILNDRLLYPNTDSTFDAIADDLNAFLGEVFGPGAYTASRAYADPRARFAVHAIKKA
jgi:hypothetical protein